MGALPTKTCVELRGKDGATTLPAATSRSAGVMTAAQVQMLEELYTAVKSGAANDQAPTPVVIERPVPAEPVDLTPLREEMAKRIADALSQTNQRIEAVRKEAQQAIANLPAPQPVQPPQPLPKPFDPTPLYGRLEAEISRVRKDLAETVERTYADLKARLEKLQADKPSIDPDELARQVQAVVTEEIDKALGDALRKIEAKADTMLARQPAIEYEPGAVDEDGPLPHIFDDWRGRGHAPEPDTPEKLRARAIRAIADAAEKRRGAVTSPYPGKRHYYQLKANIAFKWKMAPNKTYTDMLSREAARKGLTVEELCDRIVARYYEAERLLQQIHDAEAEGITAVMHAPDEGIVAAERAAIERIEAIGGTE